MLLHDLEKKKLIHPPSWLCDNTMYLGLMGSVAYGVSCDTSDCDLYGWCVPRKEIVFPHLNGEILGFGRQKERFEQFQKHHIKDNDKTYDITIYNIVKYFQLCMDNNPNLLDSLYIQQECVWHNTQVGQLVRDNRTIFLHKGSYYKFRGYAFSQLTSVRRIKNNTIIKKMRILEQHYNIPHTTTFNEVKQEMKSRNLL